ncbi:MAG TPA: kynureninase [Caldimonas sp.]|jgi:kynureninase|nr:kynureninase [Caldimonas sp.]HEV7577781.1 kynureninase [Caldimonas sp.]
MDEIATAPPPIVSREACLALDRADPLAQWRDEFVLPDGVVYLDGNSLGALPRRTAARLAEVAEREWGEGLIRSWNSAGWIDLARRIGDKIAALIGAHPGEVSVGDSTSINLFKTLSAAVALQRAEAPARRVILSERGNFPTDLYIAESVAESAGLELRLVDGARIGDALNSDVAVLMLTHVSYRSGRMHQLAETTRAAHGAGALVVWDLAHSAGAVPVDLRGADADFAVGCGYKYLNGGPGAPAFLWAHPRHTVRMDRAQLRQPLSGWLGHAAPFDFAPAYRPASGIARFVCGTPSVLGMAALECGVDVFAATEPAGGIAAIRAKSIALTDLFIAQVEARCAGMGLALVTPRDAASRGSQASFAHGDGYRVMQALIERGVIGDFRAGETSADAAVDPALAADLLRFGFTPLYTRFVDAWDAAAHLHDVLASGEHRAERFARRATVT